MHLAARHLQRHRYTGKPFDEDGAIDLYYYGRRYYDPLLGRFLAIDPAASMYPSWSPYVYTLDNPLKYVDPDGEFVETAVDVVSVGLSAYDMYQDLSWANAGWLALDVVSAAVPFVPAVGVASGRPGRVFCGGEDIFLNQTGCWHVIIYGKTTVCDEKRLDTT